MDIEVVDSAKARPPALRDRERPPSASDDDEPEPTAHRPHAGPGRAAPRIRSGSTCARWAGSPSSPARARSRSPSASRRARTRPPAPSSPPTSPSSKFRALRDELRERRHPDQGRGRLQRGGVHRGEGGRAAPLGHPRAAATSTGSCASGSSSPQQVPTAQGQGRQAARSEARAEPAWKRVDGQAQSKQSKVLATLRGLNLAASPSSIDVRASDLKKLVEKIQRAEREIALWSDGRRPAPDRGRRRSSPRWPTTIATTATATSTRRPRPSTPRSRSGWCGWPSRRSSAPRSWPDARADELKRIVNVIKAGRGEGRPGQEGDGRGQPAARHLHRQEVHEPRACSSST